jgi:Fe2+ transport system protein FeoA
MLTLDMLPIYATAKIVAVHGCDNERTSLEELGFLPEEPVYVVGKASFNGPMAVRVSNSVFALRLEEAALIEVHA